MAMHDAVNVGDVGSIPTLSASVVEANIVTRLTVDQVRGDASSPGHLSLKI